MKKLLLLLSLSILFVDADAQNTDISGVINSYESVSAISGNTITIGSTAAFSQGDMALIIQMKGVTMDETNTASFGDVLNYNNAGNYELVTVCDVPTGTELSVSNIQRSYDLSGTVQVVRVPVYEDATVTSTVTGTSWDGTSGGVIALKCNGSLTLNADIDAEGIGFNGAPLLTSSYSCQWFIIVSDYFVTDASGEGSLKGEGIADYITDKTSGKGAQTNGGGGGNDHNSGGGGGGNGGQGGQGGERIPQSAFYCSGQHPGVGGKAQMYNNTENRIFLGGGGGAGHENNTATGTPGVSGGGIVIIVADTIYGNSSSIIATGTDATDSQDGAGGGGAGGTILIESAYSGNLNIDVSGGDGGNVNNGGPTNCNGPGGGGGGGVLWYSQSSLPAEITLTNSGGLSGLTVTASQANCVVGSANSATDGVAGVQVANLNIPTPVPAASGTDTIFACLSHTWLDGNTYFADTIGATHTISGGAVNGCDSVVILDLTINSIDTSITQLQAYLISTGNFDSIQWFKSSGTIGTDGCGDNQILLTGETDDTLNTWNYTGGIFFAVIYLNGCSDTTACFYQDWESIIENSFSEQINIYPNPSSGQFNVTLGEVLNSVNISILDLSGRILFSNEFFGVDWVNLNPNLPAGSYLLHIESEEKQGIVRLLIE